MANKYEFDAVRWLRNIAEVQSHRAGAGAAMLRENMLKCAWEIELLSSRVARLEDALKTTADNIESLGPAGALGPGREYEEWLALVEGALEEK